LAILLRQPQGRVVAARFDVKRFSLASWNSAGIEPKLEAPEKASLAVSRDSPTIQIKSGLPRPEMLSSTFLD
jgi:hypothetical protein